MYSIPGVCEISKVNNAHAHYAYLQLNRCPFVIFSIFSKPKHFPSVFSFGLTFSPILVGSEKGENKRQIFKIVFRKRLF